MATEAPPRSETASGACKELRKAGCFRAIPPLQANQRLGDRMLGCSSGVSTRRRKMWVSRNQSELEGTSSCVIRDVRGVLGCRATGRKHVLEGVRNATNVLEELVEARPCSSSTAPRRCAAPSATCSAGNLVQRCRNHKVRNVLGHLPKAQHEQARSTLRAQAGGRRGYPQGEAVRGVGGAGMAIGGGQPAGRRELFATASGAAGAASVPDDDQHHRFVARRRSSAHAARHHWRNGEMAVRWAATTFCETEKNFRRVTGYQHLWMLKATRGWRPC